jgi:hypothetical protein
VAIATAFLILPSTAPSAKTSIVSEPEFRVVESVGPGLGNPPSSTIPMKPAIRRNPLPPMVKDWTTENGWLLLPTDHPIIGVSWTLVYEIYFVFACALAFGSRLASILASFATIMLLLGLTIQFAGTDAFLSNPIQSI